MQSTTSPGSAGWSSTDQSALSDPGKTQQGNGSPNESKSAGFGFLRGFGNPVQKKVTRDGQPAKRRGPKPDSKPAQTRRQELNRQAQRTHRERKEHYIKALELEVARLREVFVSERTTVENHLRLSEYKMHEVKQENMLLREILNARGIAFEVELQQRKNALGIGSAQSTGGISPSYSATHHSSPFNNAIQAPSQAGMSDLQHTGYSNGGGSVISGHSPGQHNNPSPILHLSHSPPELYEGGVNKADGVAVMPGIFEKDPQLGIDFILALEETCRDHGEYLVRRSLNSPSDKEQALFSGHALMATVPPPSHIERTPAQKGGLQLTYPHQTPQASVQALEKLLNLSEAIKTEGYVEGGQITPIMALQSLRGHTSYTSLTREDVVGMIDSIKNKVRCYGFGAVMEDFELRDALSAIFATKPEAYANFGHEITTEIDEMYS